MFQTGGAAHTRRRATARRSSPRVRLRAARAVRWRAPKFRESPRTTCAPRRDRRVPPAGDRRRCRCQPTRELRRARAATRCGRGCDARAGAPRCVAGRTARQVLSLHPCVLPRARVPLRGAWRSRHRAPRRKPARVRCSVPRFRAPRITSAGSVRVERRGNFPATLRLRGARPAGSVWRVRFSLRAPEAGRSLALRCLPREDRHDARSEKSPPARAAMRARRTPPASPTPPCGRAGG